MGPSLFLQVINEENFRRHFIAYEDLANEVVDDFIRLLPKMLTNIEAAIKSGSPEAVELAAHTLKGAASNFFAERLIETARQMEELARNQTEMPEMRFLLTKLHNEASALKHCLIEMVRQRVSA